MIETDILVVGAGPGGSLAAKEAASHGAKVLLIDRKSEIGSPKRCAEGVLKQGLIDLGIKPDPRWIARDLSGIRFVAPDGTNLYFDNDTIQLPELGYVLERKIFDKHMAMDAVRAGAKIMIKTNATSLKRVDDGVIVTANHMGKEIQIHAHIVIAADGVESRIGRWAGLKCNTSFEDMESCIQFEMAGLEMENNNDITLFVGSVAPGGYIWIFPKGDDIANVGIGVLKTRTDKSAYEHLMEFIKICPETKNAQIVEMNVGGDPVGGIVKERAGDNILIVGDAAGFVNPLTGGGIYNALESGIYAGKVAAMAIIEEDYSKKYLKEYIKLTDEHIGKNSKKYNIVKEYLLTIDDDEFNKMAAKFSDKFDKLVPDLQKTDFNDLNLTSLIKLLIKVYPKALFKLGKLF